MSQLRCSACGVSLVSHPKPLVHLTTNTFYCSIECYNKIAFKEASAFNTQVGGSHYKKCKIQPMEYTLANGLGYCEGTAIKYITRWKDKGGIQDLQKAIHFLQLLIEHTEKNGNGKD